MADGATVSGATSERFPPVFWAANVTELFERAAYYSMASFIVIYLGRRSAREHSAHRRFLEARRAPPRSPPSERPV